MGGRDTIVYGRDTIVYGREGRNSIWEGGRWILLPYLGGRSTLVDGRVVDICIWGGGNLWDGHDVGTLLYIGCINLYLSDDTFITHTVQNNKQQKTKPIPSTSIITVDQCTTYTARKRVPI